MTDTGGAPSGGVNQGRGAPPPKTNPPAEPAREGAEIGAESGDSGAFRNSPPPRDTDETSEESAREPSSSETDEVIEVVPAPSYNQRFADEFGHPLPPTTEMEAGQFLTEAAADASRQGSPKGVDTVVATEVIPQNPLEGNAAFQAEMQKLVAAAQAHEDRIHLSDAVTQRVLIATRPEVSVERAARHFARANQTNYDELGRIVAESPGKYPGLEKAYQQISQELAHAGHVVQAKTMLAQGEQTVLNQLSEDEKRAYNDMVARGEFGFTSEHQPVPPAKAQEVRQESLARVLDARAAGKSMISPSAGTKETTTENTAVQPKPEDIPPVPEGFDSAVWDQIAHKMIWARNRAQQEASLPDGTNIDTSDMEYVYKALVEQHGDASQITEAQINLGVQGYMTDVMNGIRNGAPKTEYEREFTESDIRALYDAVDSEDTADQVGKMLREGESARMGYISRIRAGGVREVGTILAERKAKAGRGQRTERSPQQKALFNDIESYSGLNPNKMKRLLNAREQANELATTRRELVQADAWSFVILSPEPLTPADVEPQVDIAATALQEALEGYREEKNIVKNVPHEQRVRDAEKALKDATYALQNTTPDTSAEARQELERNVAKARRDTEKAQLADNVRLAQAQAEVDRCRRVLQLQQEIKAIVSTDEYKNLYTQSTEPEDQETKQGEREEKGKAIQASKKELLEKERAQDEAYKTLEGEFSGHPELLKLIHALPRIFFDRPEAVSDTERLAWSVLLDQINKKKTKFFGGIISALLGVSLSQIQQYVD